MESSEAELNTARAQIVEVAGTHAVSVGSTGVGPHLAFVLGIVAEKTDIRASTDCHAVRERAEIWKMRSEEVTKTAVF